MIVLSYQYDRFVPQNRKEANQNEHVVTRNENPDDDYRLGLLKLTS